MTVYWRPNPCLVLSSYGNLAPFSPRNEAGFSAGDNRARGIPYYLYIREARRMIGPCVMTQHDVQNGRRKDDSVLLGSQDTDSAGGLSGPPSPVDQGFFSSRTTS